MRVSAIVCVRNGAERLGRALDSIRRQSPRVDEVVVVDGASADGSAQIAAASGARVVAQAGDGLGDARNLGIAATTGRLIAFLDHDDRWTDDKLAVQLRLLAATAAPAWSIAHLRLVADAGAGAPLPGPRGEPRLGRTPGTLLAHRAVLERVGAFDASLGMGCDMEWFARAADRAGDCRVAAETLLLKTVRADALSADPAGNRAAAFRVIARRLHQRRASRPG